MVSDETLVSVVTPSYNQGRFIEETLTSVAAQDYDNIEHIVIDAGSTDSTIEILGKFESRYDLQWISEPDDGQAQAINKGFSMADGEIVAWLNSDDVYFYRDTVRTVVDVHERTKDDLILYGHAVKISPAGEFIRIKMVPRFNRNRLLRRCFVVQPSVFFPRRVIEEEQLDEGLDYSMDYEYWLRLSEAFGWKRVDRILSADRNHEDRKIIRDEAAALAESEQIRAKYAAANGVIDDIVNLAEIARGRVVGLKYLAHLRNTDLAVDVEIESLPRAVSSQLFVDDRATSPPLTT